MVDLSVVWRSRSVLEQMLEPASRLVAVDARRHENVRGECREAARHRPDVEVVHLFDLRVGDEGARDVVGIDSGRRGLEEDAARLADQRPARADHQHRYEQRSNRIEAVPAGDENQHARDRGADERHEIRCDVQEGALHVEAGAVSTGKHDRGGEVDGHPDECDDDDDAGVDARRIDQAPHRGIDDPQSEQQEQDPVRLRGKDLRAAEAERPLPACGTGCEPRGDERRREGCRIGEHVAGIPEQGERAGDDAGGDLPDHERGDQPECDRDRALVAYAAVIVCSPWP